METLPVDVRKRYAEKTSVIQVDPYELSTSDFNVDFRKWPDLSYVDMVYFLIFQHSFYTREQLRNVKSLDAYGMQQDGWVRELFHKEISGNHLIKSKVSFHSSSFHLYDLCTGQSFVTTTQPPHPPQR